MSLYLFCASGKTVSREAYVIAHQIDLDGFYDLLEMDEIQASWTSAGLFDADMRAGG